MKDKDISELIKKARKSMKAAAILLKENYPDFSAGHSYYAMFYSAEAILLSKNLSFSKHKAVISVFGKEFIKNGILAVNLHRYISDAFDLRQAGDYGIGNSVSREKAESLLKNTREFIEAITDYLSKQGYNL